jgi:hypothetical protein
MTALRPLNSAGQSASLVMRKSAVRIRKGAHFLPAAGKTSAQEPLAKALATAAENNTSPVMPIVD